MGSASRATVSVCCFALCAAMLLGTAGAPVAAKTHAAMPLAPRPAAVLTVISGSVAMRAGGSAFLPAADGAVIYVGSTIRTSADSRAVITLFEGSTVELEPASDITVEEATTRGHATIVDLAQSLGRTWHVVTHLTTADSRYQVKTPAATASVRGTAFEVAVVEAPGGPSTTVTTTDGLVATTDASGVSSVLVAPDEMTTVHASASPDPPRSVPEAQRVVTVTAASESAVVVDPLGRANGFRNGKVLAQTPGARVRMESGVITVALPNVPEGVFTTSVARGAAVPVSTTVMDRGQEPVNVTTAVTGGPVGVEVRDTAGRPEVRALDAGETRKLRGDTPGALKDRQRATARPVVRMTANARATDRSLGTGITTTRPDGTVRPALRRAAAPAPSPNRR